MNTPTVETLLAQALLELKSVREELQLLHEKVDGNPRLAEGWCDVAKASIALASEGIKSKRHLSNLRNEGAFAEEKGEIRNVTRGEKQGRWEYNVPKCRKALHRYFKHL
jgi:hypothetical protein